MATERDVRRIALSLPETREDENHFAFAVHGKGKPKGIAWVWMERVHPKKPRVARPGVIAIRVASETMKEDLLASDPNKFSPSRTTTVTRRFWSGCRKSRKTSWKSC